MVANVATKCPRGCKKCGPGANPAVDAPICTECNGDGFTTVACTACKPGYAYDDGAAATGICIGQDNDAAYSCTTDFFWD